MNEQALAEQATAGADASAETANDETKNTTEVVEKATEAEVIAQEQPEAGDDDAGEKKRVPGSQKWRLKAIEAQQALAQREAELAEMRKTLGKDAPVPGIGPKPTESEYPDFFEYQSALAGWEAAKRLKQAELATKEQGNRVQSELAEIERQEALEASVEKARKSLPDYDQVVNDAVRRNVPVSQPLLQEIASSDKAALLQYHLCKPENSGLLRELNQLDGVSLVRAVARLEGRLSYPRAKTETSAPPPMQPLAGGASPKGLNSLSHEDFKAMFKRK